MTSEICQVCKNAFKKMLNDRIEDILEDGLEHENQEAGDIRKAHCFHLMEIERLLDGEHVGFGRHAKNSEAKP